MTTMPFAQRFSCTIPEAEEGTGIIRRTTLYGLMKAKKKWRASVSANAD